MKNQKRFEFELPMLVAKERYGVVRIEGVVYQELEQGFDIDGIHFEGMNILPVLKWLGEGSVNELDKVFYATEAHCEYVRMNWSDARDISTDVRQYCEMMANMMGAGLDRDELKQRRA